MRKFLNLYILIIFIFCHLVTLGNNNEKSPQSKALEKEMKSGYECIDLGDYPTALKHYFNALEIAEDLKDNYSIAKAQSSLGSTYYRLQEYPKALKHLLLAEQGFRTLDSTTNDLSHVYYKLGLVHDMLPKKISKDKVLYYYNQALKFQQDSNCTDLGDIYNGFAGYYYRKHILDSVEYYAKLALKQYEICGTPQLQSAMYINIAALLNSQKRHNEAVEYNKKGIKIAEEEHIIEQLAQGYKNLAETYSYMKNYKSAYNTFVLYTEYKDSLVSEAKSRAVVEFSKQYETQEKEKQILLQKTKLNNRNKLLWIMGGVIIAGLIVSIVISYLLRSIKRQNIKLKKLNDTKNKVFSIISHDLKSTTIAQKVAIESLKPQIDALEDQNLKEYYGALQEYTEHQLNIIVNLLHWARTQTDKISYNPRLINIIQPIHEEIKLNSMAGHQKNIAITTDLPEECNVFADEQMLRIVIRNLISNAIKFTNTSGNIKVTCQCSEQNATISISDNGIGMPEETIKRIYAQEQNIDVHKGTKGEQGTGLGLVLCNNLLLRNNSKLLIERQTDKGTRVYFNLRRNP